MSIFTKVATNRPKRSAFDLSHEKKLSCKIGDLIPIMLDEVVPGDTFDVQSEVMVRLAPMMAPVMHRMNAYIHYFYVPNRIIWDKWQDFITGNEDKLPLPKAFTSSKLNVKEGTLSDYFGLPIPSTNADYNLWSLSALPFRAYQAIYWEFYRDQNLGEQKTVEYDPENNVWPTTGSEADKVIQLRKRAWEKDYFTSALPFTQKFGEGALPMISDIVPEFPQKITGETGVVHEGAIGVNAGGELVNETNDERLLIDTAGWHGGASFTINDFRTAHRLQKWFERQARAGSRYVETLMSHFGQKIPDQLYRPQYLGGGKTPIVVSEVLNTNANQSAQTDDKNAPLGDMAGHGIGVGRVNRARKTFQEHGWIMGIMSIIPKASYTSQGVERMWTRKEKFDFYWPEFANLGEQEVKNIEIFAQNNVENNEKVFGYQSRYAEYKYKPSAVSGDFRDSMEFWHMGRKFETLPVLNNDFIQCDHTEVSRIFAVPTGENENRDKDHLWVQVYNKVTAVRPMPYYSIPSL